MNESNEKEINLIDESCESEENKELKDNSTGISSEKLETKGLKLKKSTKERLNTLQSSFGDAETMISALLNQYESLKIQSDSKFADRKAEIEKFNYLLDSIRGSYLNSLDMATYLEEKYNEKFEGEIKKRERLILSIQDQNSELMKEVKEKDKVVIERENELKEVKESYSRINVLLSTLEKDTNEKSLVIQNLQSHIESLKKLVEDDNSLKEEKEEMSLRIAKLQEQATNYEFSKKEIHSLNSEIQKYKNEVIELKEELKKEREYSNELNNKLHSLLMKNSSEVSALKDHFANEIKILESEKIQLTQENNKSILKLKEVIYQLNLELELLKTK